MKERIALINPNSPFLTNERVFPNIGLVRVATQLKANGYNVDLLDCAGVDYSDSVAKQIANSYDIFGFSSTTPQFPRVFRMNHIIKENNKHAKTILGGAHASAMYPLVERGDKDINVTDLYSFDTIFAGEAELDNAERIFEKGMIKVPIIKSIDDTLVPDKSLIDIKSYKYYLNGTNIQTQRGCPHQCTFCSGRDTEMYNKVRQHSPERVLKEMDEQNKEYGLKSFMWYDDEINLNVNRLEELCIVLSTRDYQHRGFIRSDNIVKYPESVEWMKKAGFVKLCAGVESGSNRMLKNINKKTTREMNLKARQIIKDAGIHYESFLLLGHPGEEISDVEETKSWIEEAKPDDFDINLVTPYPGSKTYDNAIPSNELEGYNWNFNSLYFNKPRFSIDDTFYKGKGGESESNVRTKTISNPEYRLIRKDIDRRFKR